MLHVQLLRLTCIWRRHARRHAPGAAVLPREGQQQQPLRTAARQPAARIVLARAHAQERSHAASHAAVLESSQHPAQAARQQRVPRRSRPCCALLAAAAAACRAGAASCTAVESVRSLAEAATAVVAANGMHRAINVLHKDARFIKPAAGPAPGAASADPASAMQPSDLLVFEVRAC